MEQRDGKVFGLVGRGDRTTKQEQTREQTVQEERDWQQEKVVDRQPLRRGRGQ